MDSTNAYIYGPGHTPLEQVNLSTGTITYLVADQLGSVRGTVSSAGSLSASTAYDAWGNPETSGGLTAATPFGSPAAIRTRPGSSTSSTATTTRGQGSSSRSTPLRSDRSPVWLRER